MPYGARDKADCEGLVPQVHSGNLHFWDEGVSSQGGSHIKYIFVP